VCKTLVKNGANQFKTKTSHCRNWLLSLKEDWINTLRCNFVTYRNLTRNCKRSPIYVRSRVKVRGSNPLGRAITNIENIGINCCTHSTCSLRFYFSIFFHSKCDIYFNLYQILSLPRRYP